MTSKRPTEIARGTRAPGYSRAPNHRIAYVPRNVRVMVRAQDVQVADSEDVVLLEENNYPGRHYLSRDGVDMRRLERTDKVTFCPFKGLATYYVIRGPAGEVRDAAWSYEQPYAEGELIRDRISFDADVVNVTVADPE